MARSAARAEPGTHRAVSPLELLFDLVFVLAISQLTGHLSQHLSWRGAGETLVLLVGVCGVWTFTSFEVTLLDIEHRSTGAVTVVVMGLGLFMNAGIAHAFGDGPWLFAVPMLLSLAGPGLYAALHAPTRELRQHFRRVLVWVTASGVLWLTGAALGPGARLWCWSVAAFVDLVGTWTAHPTPGRVTRTDRVPFDAAHMVERMRLFLIILLGESVLALGRGIADHRSDPPTLLLALGGFVTLVCLWSVYFGRAEQVVVRHVAASDDPVRSVRLGMNVIYGVVTGLVVLAAGSDLLLAHVHAHRSGVAGALLLAGPAVYLLSHAVYFRVETGAGWVPRAVVAAALGGGGVAAYWLPPYAAVALLVAILLALTGYLSWVGRGSAADGPVDFGAADG